MEGKDIVEFTDLSTRAITILLADHHKLWLGDKVNLLESLRAVIKVVSDKAII